ncbi:MAG: hypothetical protein II956_11255 [Bacteroidales bacterium]|nr:hypothetical protein [Bacteroidales bacterium]
MKLLAIIFIALLFYGCEKGGIIADGKAVIADTLNTLPVKRVLLKVSGNQIMTDDAGLVTFGYEDNSTQDGIYEMYIAKITSEGFVDRKTITADWKAANYSIENPEEKQLPKTIRINNLYQSSDGGFFAFGAASERFSAEISMSLVKFDNDCNVIYKVCELYQNADPIDYRPLPTPQLGIPLDDDKFGILFRKDADYSDYESPNGVKWYIKVYDKEGKTVSYDILEFYDDVSYVQTAYSSGDVIFLDYTDINSVHIVKSFSLEGKLLYTQEVSDKANPPIYVGEKTILPCLKEFGESEAVSGSYFLTRVKKNSQDVDVDTLRGRDSTLILIGGVQCGEKEILYGYCREQYSGFGYNLYSNEVNINGLIIENNKIYRFSGVNPKYIIGIWYSGGLYTIYYKEFLVDKSDGWSDYINIYRTDDLKKLEN